MEFNILVGGSAGQGMDTISDFLEKVLKLKGYYVFSNKDYMSRARGGNNFTQIRVSEEPIYTHSNKLDFIIALDKNTAEFHVDRLQEKGAILLDEGVKFEHEKVISLPLVKLSNELGLSRAFGMMAIGVTMKYFGLSLDGFERFIPTKYTEQVRNINIEAVKKGYDLIDSRYDAVNNEGADTLLLNGNTSIALGAMAAGLNFYSAYPMTPATSVMTYLSKKQVEAGIVVEQVEDEIAAINMAIGASYAGARAMTGSSGGGFSLMVEALGLAGIMETPLVVVDSQRPGPATGLPTRTEQSDLSFLLTASHGEFPRMVMSVRNAEDAFYQTFRALNLAEKYQTLALILTDQYLADAKVTVPTFKLDDLKIENHIADGKVLAEGEDYKRYKLTDNGISPRLIPGKVPGQVVLVDSDEHDEYSHITESAEVRIAQMEKRMNKLELMKKDMLEPEYFGVESPEILLVGWGSTYGALNEAIEILKGEGVKIGALSFGDIYPLPTEKLTKYASKAKAIVNVEQNYTGQLGKLITQETGILMNKSILKYDGRQINGEELVARVKGEVM